MKPILFPLIVAAAVTVAPLAIAQTARPPLVIDNDRDFHRYVLYRPKPEYPSDLRRRGIRGSGKFLLHLRRDGTVESVETLTSTGNAELDDISKNAFITWRFRPGPNAVKVPITFKVPRGTPGWPFAR
jgi:TonB family protein